MDFPTILTEEELREARSDETKMTRKLFLRTLEHLSESDRRAVLSAVDDGVEMSIDALFPRHDPIIDSEHGQKFGLSFTGDESDESGGVWFREVPEHPDEPQIEIYLPEAYKP